MLISIKEKPYIVEKNLEKMNAIRYKGKLYQIEKKKDKCIIKMTRGGGRYTNTFKWEINVENEKLDIKMKKTFDSVLSRGIIIFLGIVFLLLFVFLLISFCGNVIQRGVIDNSIIVGMLVSIAIIIVCTSYTLHTSNQYLEKEVKIFLDEMLNNKEKEIR